VATHTRNPALFTAWGPDDAAAAGTPRRLTDIAPYVLRILGLPEAGAGSATSVA